MKNNSVKQNYNKKSILPMPVKNARYQNAHWQNPIIKWTLPFNVDNGGARKKNNKKHAINIEGRSSLNDCILFRLQTPNLIISFFTGKCILRGCVPTHSLGRQFGGGFHFMILAVCEHVCFPILPALHPKVAIPLYDLGFRWTYVFSYTGSTGS